VAKKILLIAFAIVLLILTFGSPCGAQTTNPCLAKSTWWWPDPIPPGWFYYLTYPGTFVYVIAAMTSGCTPPASSPCTPPGGSPSGPPGSRSSPTCTKPISLASGDTFIKQVDVKVPGLGGGLNLARTWNSLWPTILAAQSTGIFGPYWRSTYEEQIIMGGDNYLRYLRGDGSVWVFGESGGQFVVSAPATVAATLVAGTTNWVLTFQSGEQRQFNLTTGLLTAIVDRNGNTTQLTYDSLNRLVTVTSAASQHLYFNYQSSSSYLISSVTSDFGMTFSYTYDSQNRLSQVTYPDQTTVSFTYNTQSQITQVTDSNGIALESHTYDSTGRGLTGSQANGVNAVTVTYPQ
jgi:YD repeat-containing protein